MLLADVEQNDNYLHIQTLDTPYHAEIRSCLVLWVGFLGFAAIAGPAFYGLNIMGQPPGAPRVAPFGWHDFAMFLGMLTLMMMANVVLIIVDMRYALAFDLDKGRNVFIANGREIGRLTATSVRLQDRIACNRRAFRLVANVAGRDYVLVRTQCVNTDMFTGRNRLHTLNAAFDGASFKYSYGRWRDYTGAKTGFDPKWPEYVELFALHTAMVEFMGTANVQSPERSQNLTQI